jgi:23S rRNA pseudouridine955/2504/2580 synthase
MEVTGWLEKDARHSDVYIHDLKQPGDLPIITRYRVLRVISPESPAQEDTAELEVELITGRTHQIRAHFAHLGHPLLGDGKYGRNSYNRLFQGTDGPLRRQQLHATELRFSPQIKGPLAYLAGKAITIDPDFDWPKAR